MSIQTQIRLVHFIRCPRGTNDSHVLGDSDFHICGSIYRVNRGLYSINIFSTPSSAYPSVFSRLESSFGQPTSPSFIGRGNVAKLTKQTSGSRWHVSGIVSSLLHKTWAWSDTQRVSGGFGTYCELKLRIDYGYIPFPTRSKRSCLN